MANKAVIGIAALGGAAYVASERFADWRANKEKRDRHQEDQDRAEAIARRCEEEQRKKGKGFSFGGVKDDFHATASFSLQLYHRIDTLLYDLIVKVGESAKTRRNGNLQRLNLPLMSNDYGREDVMLAASLALGDSDLVDRVVDTLPKHQLGIGLKKFTPKSIAGIIKAFETVKDPCPGNDELNIFISLVLGDSDFRSRNPKMVLLKARPQGAFRQLCEIGAKLGFHVGCVSAFDVDQIGSQVKFKFRKKQSIHYHPCDQVFVSNFLCSFECSMKYESSGLYPDFDTIRLIGPKQFQRISIPNIDDITELFSQAAAARMAVVAANRLKALVQYSGIEGVSHKHIAVNSGYNGDVLKSLRESDESILEKNADNIHLMLHENLLKLVPPNSNDNPIDALSQEIESFIHCYSKLVTLSYCEIPRLSGSPPSAYVPSHDVRNEALEGSPWITKPLMVRSMRRMLVKEERDMVKRSQKLVAPPVRYSVMLVLIIWIVMSWLTHHCVMTVLHRAFSMHSLVLTLIVGQAFSVWSLYGLAGVMKAVFSLNTSDSCWDAVKCCSEFFNRSIALKQGRPTPYEQEMKRLKDQCKDKFREWKLRIARREFNEAMRRKKITNHECLLLLTEFADEYYEDGNHEVVKGVLPVELNEAEAFLKLKVDEKEDCTEVNLSPSDAVKNYLSTNRTSGSLSAIEGLNDLAAKVEGYVQFSEGDRVFVEEDRDLFIGGIELNSSTQQLVCQKPQTASVVFTTATHCFVHFDGMPCTTPEPVHIKRCSLINEQPLKRQNESSPKEKEITYNDDYTEEKKEDATPHSKKSSKKPRARTVEEALVEGGWKLERTTKHIKYSRRVQISKNGEARKQTFVLSKTPSDWRASRNALSTLRRLNETSQVTAQDPPVKKIADKICSFCGELKAMHNFSKNQAKKTEGKCKACVQLQESRNSCRNQDALDAALNQAVGDLLNKLLND